MTADLTALPPASAAPLRSSHTSNFGPLLEELGVSLLVSTYQAGKLVMLRGDEGVLNTHFRSFNVPMGLACAGDLALGVDLDQIFFGDEALAGRGRCRDEAVAVARGDVAVVVRAPTGGVEIARGLGDGNAQLLHAVST